MMDMIRTSMMAVTFLLAFLGETIAADEIQSFETDFEEAIPGTVPKGWEVTKTGSRDGSVWKVLEDQTSPKGAKVLAQTAKSPGSVFNLCVFDGGSFKDVEVRVILKSVKGIIDQGGGIVWRYRNANNYYIARFNPLEDNYRLYKVVAGRRIQLASRENMVKPAGEWLTLGVRMKGSQIVCLLDGEELLQAEDDTFTESGKIGLWTKADAQTYFDDIQVKLSIGQIQAQEP